ncbi:FAST kinase domain-containing protein 2, mitochondrial [Eublepharis macularius]|uniref:FAST kinase domain-containing protein 2, mitochondrial n=1 Tax=Eublepharis macularius TaxID=481883 RepID=A0AA97IUL5_EUBMA|nr:FAST kinase domain-containing protein 2, mitochondrial [Eublepharis macularius]XP_054825883.1 FAST kinase domain-containing protein 2, mitochondrial [Eublepharis macularius]
MMSRKMNKKLDCLIRTIRQMQACPSAVNPCSRTVVRTYALGASGHKSPCSRQRLLYESPCWLHSSARVFSQDTFSMITENTSANEQKAANGLLHDQTQNSGSVTVELSRPSSSFIVTAETDRSTGEETDEKSASQKYFDDLRRCTSPCDVLDMVSRHPISPKYVSNSLATMWMLTKKLLDDQKRYERRVMFEHPQFSQLCQCVMQEAKYMWRDDLAYSLHAVVKLGVPQNTRLVQTMLRVCQERLNEFDDRSLSIVATTLQGMEKCKNVEALQAGLQLLVEQRIPKISSVFMLQTMMKCIGEDSPLSLKAKLENKILSQINQLTPPNAQHMFSVLAKMNYRSLPILSACSDKIIENIEGTPFWRLLTVLRSCKDLLYRNTVLFSGIADYVASTFYMWDTKQVVLFLSAFENLSFRPVTLMDTFAEKVISHPNSLNMKDIMAVLRAYSLLHHLPEGQDQQFLETLNSALNRYLPRIANMDLLKAVYSFCILGYLPQPALHQLLQDEVLNDLMTGAGKNTEQNEMLLHAVNVCLALEGHSVIKPATVLPVEKEPLPPSSHFPEVQEVLLTLLEDASLFRPNVQLTHGYSIDFEIQINANRKKMVPSNEADQSTDDSSLHRVAVLCAPVSAFCLGSRHPRGRLAMKMRHLRLLGYHVVLIHYPEFQKLKKDAAIELLKGEIFSSEEHLGSD